MLGAARIGAVLAAMLPLAPPGPARAQESCPALQAEADRQARAGEFDGAAATLERIFASGGCSAAQITDARRRLADSIVRRAARIQDDPARRAEYRDLLRRAVRYRTSWEAAWRLGDVELKEKAHADAARDFQAAIELLAQSLETVPVGARDPKLVEIGKYLVKRAEEARHLAASEPEGTPSRFVPAVTGHRGTGLGGVYNAEFGRGLVAERVPLPITFPYDSTDFTPDGRRAAEELAQLLRERRPASVTLTGHTDRKGTEAYNLDLSRRRAAAVVKFLKDSGIAARYEADGKGWSQPRELSNPADYSRDEIDAMNRRVEVDWKD